jgi:sarcosine oxidase
LLISNFSTTYDIIIIGGGSMGASAAYALSKQEKKVLLLEQFKESPHSLGSHAGQSRIIRKAYFEDPGYIPLLEGAYKGWNELEKACGKKLYFKSGLLYIGPQDHTVIKGVKYAASNFNIGLKELKASDAWLRPPYFKIEKDDVAVFEPDAGFVLPELTVSSLLDLSRQNGADLILAEKVLRWENKNDIVKVITPTNEYTTRQLIITAGAWTSLFTMNAIPMQVTRQTLIWTGSIDEEKFAPEKFPCWMEADHSRDGVLYGFPHLRSENYPGPTGMKIAHHIPGRISDPDHVDREPDEIEMNLLLETVNEFLPATGKNIVESKTCLYSSTPDENFVIDWLPGHEGKVIIACGFSGHGFKFVPVVGEILAALAVKGKTKYPIEFLSAKRFVN